MRNLVSILCLLGALAAVSWFLSSDASARPGFFGEHCSLCHDNDNETCNGCHHHGPQNLSATTDKAEYAPGEQVIVTFDGGNKTGWFRAILYDQSGSEIDRATGPTHMGDDRQPNPVEFPVTLTAMAPSGAGQHTWEAAWWGSPYDIGNEAAYPHGPEVRTQVTVTVKQLTPVEPTTWGKIKALWR